MLPLETKQSGGKLRPHSDLREGGSDSRGNIQQQVPLVQEGLQIALRVCGEPVLEEALDLS
jgi:hypothetical protein